MLRFRYCYIVIIILIFTILIKRNLGCPRFSTRKDFSNDCHSFGKIIERKGLRELTVATRVTVPPLCLPRRRSYSSGSFSVYGVDAETSRDAPVRIRRGCLTGRGDTSELLVKGVQLGRNVLTDEGVEDDLEQGPMPEYPEQLQPGPTDVRAGLLRSYRHLEDVVDVLVHRFPFWRVDELIGFDVVQVRPVAGHLQPGLQTIR